MLTAAALYLLFSQCRTHRSLEGNWRTKYAVWDIVLNGGNFDCFFRIFTADVGSLVAAAGQVACMVEGAT